MTIKALCICGHTKTDHKKIQQQYIGVYSECDFDTCNCIKFTDKKTGNHSTYKTTYKQQRTLQISNPDPLETDFIRCKRCNNKIKVKNMNKHIKSHLLEIQNDSTKQKI